MIITTIEEELNDLTILILILTTILTIIVTQWTGIVNMCI